MIKFSVRRGAALVTALVVLLLMMTVAGTLLTAMLAAQRESRRQVTQMQAHWLAESAMARGVALLKADPAYAGETWQPALAAAAEPTAEIVIRTEPVADHADRHKLQIAGGYPTEVSQRVRVTREIEITLPVSGAKP